MFYAKYSNCVTKSLSIIIAVMQYIYYLGKVNITISYAFVYII